MAAEIRKIFLVMDDRSTVPELEVYKAVKKAHAFMTFDIGGCQARLTRADVQHLIDFLQLSITTDDQASGQ